MYTGSSLLLGLKGAILFELPAFCLRYPEVLVKFLQYSSGSFLPFFSRSLEITFNIVVDMFWML